MGALHNGPVSDPTAPGSAHLRLTSLQQGAARVLRVEGEVDLGTAAELTEAALDQVRLTPQVLILDLTEVGFLGSSGLSALLQVREAAGPGTTLRVAAGPIVERVVQLSGLEDVLNLHATVEDAIAAG